MHKHMHIHTHAHTHSKEFFASKELAIKAPCECDKSVETNLKINSYTLITFIQRQTQNNTTNVHTISQSSHRSK